jgi:hypothetical protein
MKVFSGLLLFAIAFVWPHVAAADESKAQVAAYPVKYEGGSLRLERRKITATVANEAVVLKAGRQRISVPAKSITEISYGSEVRRRFGAAVLDVVPFMRLGEADTYYVGVSWLDATRGGEKSEAVFRLSGSEYHVFVAALEKVTGKKGVDTNQVPTVVRYGL